MRIIIFFKRALVAFVFLVAATSYAQTLEITITDINKHEGKVIVSIYDNEKNWFEKPLKEITFQTDESTKKITFEVPYGTYAISVYQDENGNGELDRNFIGIPKEPIAFGNNYKPFGDPDFEPASISFDSDYQIQTLKLYTVF